MESTRIESLESYNSIDSIDFGETVVFTKFGTDWCAPCNKIQEVLSSIDESIVYVVDVENDDFLEFLTANRIYNIPTTIIKYKSFKTQFVGLRTKDEIINMIETLKTN